MFLTLQASHSRSAAISTRDGVGSVRFDVLITGKHLHINSQTVLAGGIGISNGRVRALIGEEDLGHYMSAAKRVIDAGENPVLPGIVDGHVHVRDPGQTHKEDFATATRAAAVGGVTTILTQPNTSPEVIDENTFHAVREIGERRAIVDFGIQARLDPNRPKASIYLAANGIASFELSTNQLEPGGLIAALALSTKLKPSLGCYCEDRALVEYAAEDAAASRLADAPAFLRSLPAEVEVGAAAHLYYMARYFGTRLTYRQVSSAATLAFLRWARAAAAGPSFAIEVNPHHLLLTADDFLRLGAVAKVKPPLRSKSDTVALWVALAAGVVDLVGTDHAPHSVDEKACGVQKAPPGFPGLETMLPVLLTGVAEGRIDLSRLIQAACEFPARWFGLYPRKGSLQLGADADLVIVAPERQVLIQPAELQTKAKSSPFKDITLYGQCLLTMVRGTVVFDDGRIQVAEGHGMFVAAEFE